MTDTVQVALIVTCGSSLPAILSLIIQWVTRTHIKELAHNTNQIKDELVEATRKGAFAAGQKDQKDNPT